LYNPLFTANSNVTANPWTFPYGYNVTYWPPGVATSGVQVGFGGMGTIPTSYVNNNGASIVAPEGWDFTSYVGPSPLAFPYGNRRNIVFSVYDTSYDDGATTALSVDVTGIGTDGLRVLTETIGPLAQGANPGTNIYSTITSLVLTGTIETPVTSELLVDWGVIGETYPMQPEMVCSSWNASLQVGVPLNSVINYNVMFDNYPRNVQSNTTPGQSINFFGDYGVPTLANPASAFQLAAATQSTLIDIIFPVGNIYVKINSGATASAANPGELTAIFLQAGRDN